jgi:hypothetical protein
MNETLALERIRDVVELVDRYGAIYDARWHDPGVGQTRDDLQPQLDALEDEVRKRTRLAYDIAQQLGEQVLAANIGEHQEGAYGGHPWQQARRAIVELIAILSQREELAEIIGPVGPRLETAELHPVIWEAAARLWDDGHHRAAVQTAATALEGKLQAIAGPAIAGENLAILFSTTAPTADSPRLRLRGIDPTSKTWKSAHEGAAGMVRGAFLAVRNLVSHPGWPEPGHAEGLEMIAVLSFVAHLVDRSELERAATT